MKMKDRKNSGFTLVELVVVMVIVGVLAVISVPMYTQYVNRARAQEGVSLVGAVASAQKVYYAEHNEFLGSITDESSNSQLGVDGSANTYFQKYTVTTGDDGTSFTVTSTGVTDEDVSGWTAVAVGSAGSGTEVGLFDADDDRISGEAKLPKEEKKE